MKLTMNKNRTLWFFLATLVAGSILSTNSFSQTWTPKHYWTFNSSNPLADSTGTAPLNPGYFQSTYVISNAQSNTGVGKYLTLTGTSRAITSNVPFSPDSGFTFEVLFRPGANLLEITQFITRRDGALSIRFCYPYFRFTTKSIPTGSSTAVTDNWDLELKSIGRATYGYYMDGNWHHLVFKYNAKTGTKEIWVDGQLPTGFSKSLTPGSIPSNSGSTNSNIVDLNTNTSYYQFRGDLDEIALYTYALPNAMVYKHYQDFTQKKSYTFSNSTVNPPTASPVSAGINIQEYAPGHPNSTTDALTQLKSFPAARTKQNTTLFPNFMVFNPAHVAGDGSSSYSKSTLVQRSKEVQIDLVKNFNYALMVTSNTTRYSSFLDTNEFDGAWVKLANQNPSWKTSANTYWPQLSPNVIGKASKNPYVESKTLPSNSYMRNNAGQFLDMYGNIVTSGRTISPQSPLDSLKLDGQTQNFYITQLTTALTRSIDLLFENGEVIPAWTDAGLQKDPTVVSAFNASGLSWREFKGQGLKRLSDSYMNEWRNLSKLANSRIYHYYLNGHPIYAWDWKNTRLLQSRTNNQYYSSLDIYMQWPGNWRYWQGAAHGWQYMIEGRHEEIVQGDKLCSPVVSPGWNSNEESIVRPAQWLGFLKAVSMAGAENFGCGYFVTTTPYQNPANYVWQMVIPGYAQAVASRFDDLFLNGSLMPGDVPQSISNGNGKPGYTFYAGDMRKLVVARKHNSKALYAITGTIQPHSNMIGNAELESTATVKVDGTTLTFGIRRQGSTYIYDKTNASSAVFYQLDAWHENSHPYYWSKTFNLEAEIFDNVNTNLELKTQVPAGTTAGDYRNYTTYASFKAVSGAEYNFTPRGTAPATHYVWVRARSRGGVTTGFNISMNGVQTFNVSCVKDTNWLWYRYDSGNSAQMTLNNLALTNQKLVITPLNTNLEIDLITITPNAGNYYSTFVAPCGTAGATTATITPNGALTFCSGGSVMLSANSGTAYLWSNGATSQSISVTSSGSFTVTVTSTVGTAVSSPTSVLVNAKPANSISYSGSLTICQGNSLSLSSSATSGTYLWSTGATSKAINASTSGTYTVTVTGTNGCSTAANPVTVAVIANTPSTITPSGSTSICSGSSVILTANTGSTYLWSNGATTKSINANTAGSYVVTVSQSGGCTSVSPATAVSVGAAPTPTITANGSLSFCTGGNVVLTASSGTVYLWSNGATANSITVSTSGTYNVRVTQTGGCSATSSNTTVSVGAGSGAIPIITAGGPLSFCSGGNVTLSASVGGTYLWSTGATTQSIIVSNSGNYNVKVTYAGGCFATSTNTTVSVGTGSAPTPTITAGGSTTFCQGGSVILTATTGLTYLWSNGATTKAITASAGGNYSVAVSQTGGCSATSSTTQITVKPVATFTVTPSGPLSFCNGGQVTFNVTNSNAGSYVWYKNNVVVYSGTNTSYQAKTAGVYKMRAQLVSCGVFSIPYTVTVPCREGEVLPGELNMNAYPNPFTDMISVAFELFEDAPVSLRLYDLSGKLVDVVLDNSQYLSGESRIDYPTEHLSGGIYILELATPNATQRIKIVSSR